MLLVYYSLLLVYLVNSKRRNTVHVEIYLKVWLVYFILDLFTVIFISKAKCPYQKVAKVNMN